MITKDNIITYAYKGIASLVYTIFRKKDKIHDLFLEQDVFKEEYQSPAAKKRQKDYNNDIKKETFEYKIKTKDGRFVRSLSEKIILDYFFDHFTRVVYEKTIPYINMIM